MNKSGPIIVVDDDRDDRELLQSIFEDLKLPNELKLFENAETALVYLTQLQVNPFIILSDINMATMSGFELREQIRNDPNLNIKCIPYIFFTTGATPPFVKKAYLLSAQGIFQKPSHYGKWKDIVEQIVSYWSECISPNRF